MRRQGRGFTRQLIAAAIGSMSMAGAAFAEMPADRYWGELQYFYPTIDSTARVDALSTARPGTKITLEDELDLADRKGTPYLSLGMRLGENWRMELEYYKLDRSSSKTLERDVDWGDVTYPLGVEIDSEFNTTVYRLTGGYSFHKTAASEAGVAFGFHVTDFETSIAGQGLGPGGLAFQREARDALVPLPTLGLYGGFQVAPQVYLRGRVDYLSLEYNEYDGSLVNWMAAIDWRVHKNFGVGLGYRYVDYKLNASKSDFVGDINYKFRGPTLYLQGAF
jgi:hypothetical protein